MLKEKAAPEQKAGEDAPAFRENESHYHSKKDRVFVRAIAGHYGLKDELDRLRALPRVRKGKEIKFLDGPQCYSRHYVEPKDGITQTLHLHIEEYAPGGVSQKHGHVNEAAFYILDGRGYEIHDGIRYDWQAKPMYMFMNMLFQKLVIPRPSEPQPGHEDFRPRESEDDYNHPKARSD
jgi:hypothetical protein